MIRVFRFVYRQKYSGVLYFRWSVPRRYRHILGRSEIKRSLSTTDKQVAIIRGMELFVSIHKQIQHAAEVGMVKAPRKKKRQERVADEELENMGSGEEGAFGLIRVPVTMRDGKTQYVEIDHGDADQERQSMQALIAAQGGGQWAGETTVGAGCSASSQQADDISYTDGVRRYCGEKISSNAWTEKTAAEYASTFDLVRQILRHNPAMRAIGHREANSIKETFSSLPPNMTKGIYSGKTVRQVLRMNPTKTASPQTVRLKLQRLSSLFEWAKKHGYTDLNPFTGIAPKNRKPANEQRNRYTLDELQKLFDPTHFNREALRQPFKYWLPVLGLHTGARLAELIQLRPQDVIEDHAIPHLCILPGADYRETGKIKTVAAERKIPIHPRLIELGFLQFVGEQRARGLDRLFPEAFTIESGAKDKASKWFAGYRRRLGVGQLKAGDGRRRVDFHSFRHTFIDELKQALIDERVIAELVGHQHTTLASARYGKAYHLDRLFEAVCEVKFDVQLMPWE